MFEKTTKYEKIKSKCQSKITFVIHWDVKLICDLTVKGKVHRLAVLISMKGVSQLLTVAKISSATGKAQAVASFELKPFKTEE